MTIGGAQRRVSLPAAVIKAKARETSSRHRLFLMLELNGRKVPVYLSGSRGDFRLAFFTLKHSNTAIGDLFKKDSAAAIEMGKVALAADPKLHWIMKFEDDSTLTTRLHEDLQQLLRENIPKLDEIELSPEEFAELWHSEGFTIPDPKFGGPLSNIDAEVETHYILLDIIDSLKEFLH